MRTDKRNNELTRIRQALFGWMVFVVCALFFIAASIRSRDLLTFVGGVLFLIGCLVFIAPLISEKRKYDR